MFGIFSLALAVTLTAPDPRPELVELQLAGKQAQALARVEAEIAARREESARLGLGYLRGHLLDSLGRMAEASKVFGEAISETPPLALYSRYRSALDQDQMGHPEVAAGLVSKVAADAPDSPLTPQAVRLLVHTLGEGGDCRLLRGLRVEALPMPQRREILLAQSDCALRMDHVDIARGWLTALIEEERDDEPARGAAERLAGLISEADRSRLPMLIGFTFHEHWEFGRALFHLQQAAGRSDLLSRREAYETQLRIGLSLLSEQRYPEAALAFAGLAGLANTPAERSRAFYQEGIAHELRGAGPAADARFRQAYDAAPQGPWAGAALVSALRVEWRLGAEAAALSHFQRLIASPAWRAEAARAALFLAASDLVRGRSDRAHSWLVVAATRGGGDRLEIAYWMGRLAELERDGRKAVARYLEVLRADPYHPLAQAARARLAADPLSRATTAEARRLAGSHRTDDLYDAWLLLGSGDAVGASALRQLAQTLLADRGAAPYLRLSAVPVRRWPLWEADLARPEERLLALGVWHDGATVVRDHFPLSDPSLAFTGGQLLARGGDYSRAITVAEALREQAPDRVPLSLQPAAYRRLLYPYPYREAFLAQGKIRGVDADLLAAVIRSESRFDLFSLSPASSRGLARLAPGTAQRLAAQLNLSRLRPEDLNQPRVSIALGAAYLSALLKDFGGAALPAVAAYNAGEVQTMVWRNQCFSAEPEEFFTKIGSRDTREYVRRVMAGRVQYAELY